MIVRSYNLLKVGSSQCLNCYSSRKLLRTEFSSCPSKAYFVSESETLLSIWAKFLSTKFRRFQWSHNVVHRPSAEFATSFTTFWLPPSPLTLIPQPLRSTHDATMQISVHYDLLARSEALNHPTAATTSIYSWALPHSHNSLLLERYANRQESSDSPTVYLMLVNLFWCCVFVIDLNSAVFVASTPSPSPSRARSLSLSLSHAFTLPRSTCEISLLCFISSDPFRQPWYSHVI